MESNFSQRKRTKKLLYVCRNSEQFFSCLCAIDKVRLTGMQYRARHDEMETKLIWEEFWKIETIEWFGLVLLFCPMTDCLVIGVKNKCLAIMSYTKIKLWARCDAIIKTWGKNERKGVDDVFGSCSTLNAIICILNAHLLPIINCIIEGSWMRRINLMSSKPLEVYFLFTPVTSSILSINLWPTKNTENLKKQLPS